ncbi:hypothetical protein [Roseateles sp.]|uniref:hypothetical protein n=1 Tax=Roseateles sp. TaxID=1971397 RepID=UPI003D142538
MRMPMGRKLVYEFARFLARYFRFCFLSVFLELGAPQWPGRSHALQAPTRLNRLSKGFRETPPASFETDEHEWTHLQFHAFADTSAAEGA